MPRRYPSTGGAQQRLLTGPTPKPEGGEQFEVGCKAFSRNGPRYETDSMRCVDRSVQSPQTATPSKLLQSRIKSVMST